MYDNEYNIRDGGGNAKMKRKKRNKSKSKKGSEGQKCASRNLRFLCAYGARSWAPLRKVLLSLFRKYRNDIFGIIKKKASIYILAKLVTPSGIEPELPPWKGGVLTAWPWSLNKNRQRPTFPGSFPPSIIGAKELNYCVRDGNRCDLLAIVTGFSACGFSIWLCCCSHPAVLMYLCTLRSSVLARLVSCKISYAVSIFCTLKTK